MARLGTGQQRLVIQIGSLKDSWSEPSGSDARLGAAGLCGSSNRHPGSEVIDMTSKHPDKAMNSLSVECVEEVRR
jgi:hypothetical protein